MIALHRWGTCVSCPEPAVYEIDGLLRCMDHRVRADGSKLAAWPFIGQQTKFVHSRKRVVFYGGAGGGGKSFWGRLKFIQQLELENARCAEAEDRGEKHRSRAWGVYFRRKTKDMLQVWERAKQEFEDYDPDVEPNEQTKTLTFPNCGGAKLQFSHMEHRDNRFDHKSAEFTYVFFDELTEFEEEMFDYIDTRVRTDDPVLEPYLQVCAGSNPDGKHMAWVKRRFVDIAPPETVVRVETKLTDGRIYNYDQVFIPAKLEDNPKLMASGQYEASLLNKRPAVREAILRGNWNFASGGFFSDVWDSTIHVCPDHKPPKGAKIFRAGDWGIRSPGSIGWFYEDSDGGLTMFRHLRFQGLGVEKVSRLIRATEMSLGLWDSETNQSKLNFTRSPLDAACFADHGIDSPSGKVTIAGEFKKHGVRWKASKKDRYNGLAQIMMRLERMIPAAFEGATNPTEIERPMLRFCESCTSPIETIPVIMPDENDPNDVDTKADDHDVDCLQYACLEVAIEHEKEEGWSNDIEDDYAPVRGRAAAGGLGDGPWTQ